MNTPSTETLQQEYANGNPEIKQALERLYGKSTFVKNDYTTLKTLEDCCVKNGYQANDLKVKLPSQLAEFQEPMQAHLEALICAKAVRNGYKPDWSDGKRKWWAWFNMPNPSGLGFSFFDSSYAVSYTFVGSRLVFENKEQSDYFAKQFLAIHEKRLTK